MYKRTEWKDKVVQYPHRYRESQNSDGSIDHTLEPGTVTQAGTPLNASNFNNMEGGIVDMNLVAGIIMNGVKTMADISASPLNRNAIYRGKNLGTVTPANIGAFSKEHAIPEGLFYDLYLGDYFVLQDGTYNKEWMIAGFDIGYNCGRSDQYLVTEHSITIVPRKNGLVKGRIHDSNTTYGGYTNSEINTTMNNMADMFSNVFGEDHIVSGMVWNFVGKVENGEVKSVQFGKGRLALLNEAEIYGCMINGLLNSNNGAYTILPLFRFINPDEFTDNYEGFWFSNPYSDTEFCCTRYKGAYPYHATVTSTDYWIRPKMTIA